MDVDAPSPTAQGKDELRALLADVYLPEGVEVWMTYCHRDFGWLSVDEMFEAGRSDEVFAAARRLASGNFG